MGELGVPCWYIDRLFRQKSSSRAGDSQVNFADFAPGDIVSENRPGATRHHVRSTNRPIFSVAALLAPTLVDEPSKWMPWLVAVFSGGLSHQSARG